LGLRLFERVKLLLDQPADEAGEGIVIAVLQPCFGETLQSSPTMLPGVVVTRGKADGVFARNVLAVRDVGQHRIDAGCSLLVELDQEGIVHLVDDELNDEQHQRARIRIAAIPDVILFKKREGFGEPKGSRLSYWFLSLPGTRILFLRALFPYRCRPILVFRRRGCMQLNSGHPQRIGGHHGREGCGEGNGGTPAGGCPSPMPKPCGMTPRAMAVCMSARPRS